MSLLKKLAMLLRDARKKRPYYCEVECLIGTGEQYLDLGLYGTTQSTIDIVFGMSSADSGAVNNGAVFGGRTAQTSNTFTMFKLASQSPQYFRFDFNGQKQVANANQITWNTTSKYRFQYDGAKTILTNMTTGESHTENFVPPSSVTTSTITLFCVNTNGTKGTYYKGPIYRCQYSDGTNSVDVIPVLDWNMNPCMYDKINGVFYYNQGSGTFQYGREIHYVEYLETTSQASTSTTKPWINTLVNYWADFEIGVKLRESASNVCLSCGGGSYRFERINATNPYWRFQGGGSGYNYDSTIPITEYHVLKWKDGKISCDGEVLVEKDHLLNSGTYTVLFTNSTSSGNTIYPNVVYFLKMWNPSDGTLVRDYLPAIDENGVGFLFDRVTHTIFDNAGTGNFKYPPVELEYIKSTGSQYIDTNYAFSDDFAWEIDFEGITDGTTLFGGRTSSTRTALLYQRNYGGVNKTTCPIAGYNGQETPFQLDDLRVGRHTIKMAVKSNKGSVWVDGVKIYDNQSFSGSYISGVTQAVFADKFGNNDYREQTTSKVYSLKMWQGTISKRNYSAAYKDGVAGLWDKENSVMYPNAGTGSFVVGKIVEKEFEE